MLITQSCLTLCDPMDCQTPLSMEFSRQEYWSGLPCPSPGDPPGPEIEPGSPALQADSLPFEVPRKTPVFLVAIKYNQDCRWKSLRKSPIQMVFPPALDSSTVSTVQP